MIFKEIQNLKSKYSSEVFKEMLKAVEQDIKFNRISFGKKTSQVKFLEILRSTEIVFGRIYLNG
ncbi:hypothetical protein QTI94_08145 [Clostridium perfringens]|nr:hypothetical protein [Clostridium perfringens]